MLWAGLRIGCPGPGFGEDALGQASDRMFWAKSQAANSSCMGFHIVPFLNPSVFFLLFSWTYFYVLLFALETLKASLSMTHGKL